MYSWFDIENLIDDISDRHILVLFISLSNFLDSLLSKPFNFRSGFGIFFSILQKIK